VCACPQADALVTPLHAASLWHARRAVGWAADKRVPRHLVLRGAGAAAIAAVVATLHALAASGTETRFYLLCFALALWGVSQVCKARILPAAAWN
jgi:hypothetical protein